MKRCGKDQEKMKILGKDQEKIKENSVKRKEITEKRKKVDDKDLEFKIKNGKKLGKDQQIGEIVRKYWKTVLTDWKNRKS